MDSPSELLSAKIIERLITEKLITPDDGKKLTSKMAAGKLRPEDWRLPIELAEDKESKK